MGSSPLGIKDEDKYDKHLNLLIIPNSKLPVRIFRVWGCGAFHCLVHRGYSFGQKVAFLYCTGFVFQYFFLSVIFIHTFTASLLDLR